MSAPSRTELRQWCRGRPEDTVFVETGTYLGETLAEAAEVFGQCHSIEILENFYLGALERFRGQPRVQIVWGDSTKVLPGLMEIKNPIVFWLDAHGAPFAQCGGCVPLLAELRIVTQRDRPLDVIAIDDTRAFGTYKGDDWSGITMPRVRAILEPAGFTQIEHFPETLSQDQMTWHCSGVLVASKP